MKTKLDFRNPSRRNGLMILLAVMIGLLFYYFGPVLIHPLEYFMAYGGDATKNYYVPAYYIKYDQGLLFTGMNYPYGEHILFADGNFPISWVLQSLQRLGINVADYTSAIINYLMLSSFVMCAAFIYLLLFELRINVWFAIGGAIGTTLLSPQLQRLSGHYSLAYAFYIPALFWLLYKIVFSKNKIRWSAYILLLNLFFGLLHLYHAAMGGAFLISFAVIYAIHKKIRKEDFWKTSSLVAAAAIIPVILIQLFISLTDNVSDRIKIPWGFDESYATFDTVFKPPTWSHFNFFKVEGSLEGYAFIGVVTWWALAFFMLRQLTSFHKRRWKKFLMPSVNDYLIVLVYASIPVLLFAMQYPWRWNLRWMVDEVPAITQFRSLGRFAWVFYYATSIFACYIIHAVWRTLRIKHLSNWSTTLIIILAALWFFDGQSNVKPVKAAYEQSKLAASYWRDKELPGTLNNAGYKASDFQAIIGMPYTHIGSEKIWLEGWRSSLECLKLSYHTGLPMVNVHLGRTSISQTASLVQLTSHELIARDLNLPNKKPLLVVKSTEALSPGESFLVSRSKFISRYNDIEFYALYLDSLKPDWTKCRERFFKRMDSLFHENDMLVSDSSAAIIHQLISNDTLHFLTQSKYYDYDTVVLYNGMLPRKNDTLEYNMSYWVKIYPRYFSFPNLYYKCYDRKENFKEEAVTSAHKSHDIYQNWVRQDLNFRLTDTQDSVVLFVVGHDIEIARLLIRPSATDVYLPMSDSSFVFNNYYVPKE